MARSGVGMVSVDSAGEKEKRGKGKRRWKRKKKKREEKREGGEKEGGWFLNLLNRGGLTSHNLFLFFTNSSS